LLEAEQRSVVERHRMRKEVHLINSALKGELTQRKQDYIALSSRVEDLDKRAAANAQNIQNIGLYRRVSDLEQQPYHETARRGR
jgi:hypothetical protein